MTTLNFKGKEYNVVLIDPSIETAGDGLTPSTAMKTLPSILVNNTCYLFRRTDNTEVFVSHQKDNTLVNLMFLGMPKATDEQWIQDLITDETINNAWKADEAKYANVRFWHVTSNTDYNTEARACINSSELEDLTCINCYLYRGQASATSNTSTYMYSACPFFNNNGSTTYKANYRFYGCKFGVLGIDLDNDEWVKNNASPNGLNSGQQIYSRFGRLYICATTANILLLKNCIVNHIDNNTHNAQAFSTDINNRHRSSSAFLLYNANHINVSDTSIYTCTSTADESSSADYFRKVFIAKVRHAIMKNITSYNILGCHRLSGLADLNIKNSGVCRINNIDLRFKLFKGFTSTSTYKVGEPGIDIRSNYNDEYCGIRDFEINNVSLYGNGEDGVYLAQGNAITVDVTQGMGSPYIGKIKNINVNLCDDINKCVVTSYSTPMIETNNWFEANRGTCLCFCNTYDLHKNMSAGIPNTDSSTGTAPMTGVTMAMENININAPYTWLNFGRRCFTQINDEIRCGVAVDDYCNVDIKKVTFDKFTDQSGIKVNDQGSYLRIREFVGPVGDAKEQLSYTLPKSLANTCVYIDKSNINLIDENIYTNTGRAYENTQLCCPNHGYDGKFIARNMNVFAKSWGVTREGSKSPAVLKLYHNNKATSYALNVGGNPFKGLVAMPTETGNKNFVAHIAYKDFTDSNENIGNANFTLEIRVPQLNDDGSITYTVYHSTTDGEWEPDDAIWSDGDVIARKIVVPVKINTTNEPIEVKIFYNWYSVSGYVYIDPDFEIV